MHNKALGLSGEKMFRQYCQLHGAECIRIEDGAVLTKGRKFIRKPQLCDFIVVKGEDTYLIDVKRTRKYLTKSFFFRKDRKILTPTERQAAHFAKLYYHHDFHRAGFFIIQEKKIIGFDGWWVCSCALDALNRGEIDFHEEMFRISFDEANIFNLTEFSKGD